MTDFERPGLMLERPVKRRSTGSRFADLGDRLARTFGSLDRAGIEDPAVNTNGEHDYAVDEDLSLAPRFPVARHGYDRASVDEYVDELERELDALRGRNPLSSAVSVEIERLGEQTAAILRVAHEQAHEITRKAQVQADKCVADAATNAISITEEAHRKLSALDTETDSVWRERERLIEDVRAVATALFAVAEDAAERFPAEPEKARPPAPVPASQPTVEARIVDEPAVEEPNDDEPAVEEPVAQEP
jgi:DivIVA domain-containing protein